MRAWVYACMLGRCMHAWMHVSIRGWMYMHVCTCMLRYADGWMDGWMYVCMLAYMHACMLLLFVCMYVCIYEFMYEFIYVHICMYNAHILG